MSEQSATPLATPGHAGEIHDIGYRHYEGPRLGAAYIRRSLFVETLRGTYGLGRSARSKIVPLSLLAIMALPAIVIGIVAYSGVLMTFFRASVMQALRAVAAR